MKAVDLIAILEYAKEQLETSGCEIQILSDKYVGEEQLREVESILQGLKRFVSTD